MNNKTLLLIIALVCSTLMFGQQEIENQSINDTTVYSIVPTPPKFGKNEKSLQKFIKKESKFKMSKTKTPTTKNVYVQIIIEKDGNVSFVKIIRGTTPKFNNEAIRIIKNMPNWSIGKVNDGTPVRVGYIIPFWFK